MKTSIMMMTPSYHTLGQSSEHFFIPDHSSSKTYITKKPWSCFGLGFAVVNSCGDIGSYVIFLDIMKSMNVVVMHRMMLP